MLKLKYCSWCKEPFQPTRRNQRFCCVAHRVAEHRDRHPMTEKEKKWGWVSKKRIAEDRALSDRIKNLFLRNKQLP